MLTGIRHTAALPLGTVLVGLVVAWVMGHPVVTAPIIGARSTDHIDGALVAHRMGLDPEVRAEMSAWSAR